MVGNPNLDPIHWLVNPITIEALELYRIKGEITGRDIIGLFHKEYGSKVSEKSLESHAAIYERRMAELGIFEHDGYESGPPPMSVKFKLNRGKLREHAAKIFADYRKIEKTLNNLGLDIDTLLPDLQ